MFPPFKITRYLYLLGQAEFQFIHRCIGSFCFLNLFCTGEPTATVWVTVFSVATFAGRVPMELTSISSQDLTALSNSSRLRPCRSASIYFALAGPDSKNKVSIM